MILIPVIYFRGFLLWELCLWGRELYLWLLNSEVCNMDWKLTKITFPRKLNPKEEEWLIAVFQGVTSKLRGKIKRAKDSLDWNPAAKIANQAYIEMYKSALANIHDNFYSFIKLETEDNQTYVFRIAYKAFDGMTQYQINPVKYWEKLQGEFINFTRKTVCRKIAINPDDIKIEYGEE